MADHPYFDQEHTTRRGVVVLMLIAVAVIHATNDLTRTWHDSRGLFWASMLLILVALVVAELLVRYDHPLIWAASGALALATIAAYVTSRSVGLPGDHKADVGNWTEAVGIAALIVEAILVLMVLAHFTTLHRNPRE